MNQQDQPIRTAILGLAHDHIWDHLPELSVHPQIDLVGAAEPRDDVREKFSREFDLPAFETFDPLLDDPSLEAVWVFSDNRQGAQLAAAALRRNLHVVIEKPMAASLAAADQMLALSLQQQKRLIVNWPFAWWPQLQHALTLAQSGVVGRVWQVRYRAAHAGPKELGCSDAFCDWLFDDARNGEGGAMMDYCCYGALLAAILLGLPTRVTGVAGRLTKREICVNDNAMITMEYPEALAVAEGSWSQIGKLGSYTTMIYGSTGTLLVEPRSDGNLLLASDEYPEGQIVETAPADAAFSSATEHFVSRILQHEPLLNLCCPQHARNAQEILEAGARSAKRHRAISLPL